MYNFLGEDPRTTLFSPKPPPPLDKVLEPLLYPAKGILQNALNKKQYQKLKPSNYKVGSLTAFGGTNK